ncbi:hypothetical protein FAM09_07695 [Niastella caeni]|uniref:DUF6265 domain-containing protein n=1 Tax=Niastella caeni TaxID=2569763 RepID=A0A4V4H1V9_9BACT|nr:DUF6265 family protein [Niastella caeni]THU41976.1 hypothetical protein FAM09_07695 [Niastella caeni]
MKKWVTTIWLLLILLNVSKAQPGFSNREFKPLHKLTGLWKMDSQRGAIYEEWEVKNDKELLGRSYKIRNNDTVLLENVIISLQGDAIFYTPVVQDQNNRQPVLFKLISCNNNRYVFENKEHDFPQRVIYDLASANDLRARIEGSKNGKEMGSDFNYTRVK